MSLIFKFNENLNVTGKLLKEYRLKNNLSYEMLSTKLALMGINIHRQSLYDIEHNKRTVKDYELFALAHILKIDVNDLLQDIEKEFKSEKVMWKKELLNFCLIVLFC